MAYVPRAFDKLTFDRISYERMRFGRVSFDGMTFGRMSYDRMALGRMSYDGLTFGKMSWQHLFYFKIFFGNFRALQKCTFVKDWSQQNLQCLIFAIWDGAYEIKTP
jgi:hypothetical protein